MINAQRGSLVLMCKRPLLGQGKQRIAATLGSAAALMIADALLACALEDLTQWPGAVVIAVADNDDLAWGQALLSRATVVAQGAGNLGERLQCVDRALRLIGHSHGLFIGSDAPALCLDDYLAAERALLNDDIVLIPARDGGVVLMGNRQPWPALANLPWSTAQLGAALTQRCDANALSIAQLAEKFDIDEYDDLSYCRAFLDGDRRPARQNLLRLLNIYCNVSVANNVEPH